MQLVIPCNEVIACSFNLLQNFQHSTLFHVREEQPKSGLETIFFPSYEMFFYTSMKHASLACQRVAHFVVVAVVTCS